MVSLICDDNDNGGDKNSDGDENDDDKDVGNEKDNDEKDDDDDVGDEKDNDDNNDGISGFCVKDAIGARQQLLGHRRRSYVIPLP